MHEEELHNLYRSPNMIRVVKSGRVRCLRHASHMGRREIDVKSRTENPKERDLGVYGRIILKWIIKKEWRVWDGFN
jgi:hypothetical protein